MFSNLYIHLPREMANLKILLICKEFPYPPISGDKIRNFNLIKRLSKENAVYLISFIYSENEKDYASEMNKMCSGVETVLLKKYSKLHRLFNIIGCLTYGQPLENAFHNDAEMALRIRRAVREREFDIIQIEHSIMAQYIRYIPKHIRAKTILTFHNIGFIQFHRMFAVEVNMYKKVRYFLNWFPMSRWEPKIAMKFDKCIVMTNVDKKILEGLRPSLDVSVIPTGVDLNEMKPLGWDCSKNNVLFVGQTVYRPNFDAVMYFYNEIFAKILKEIPDTKFFVVGNYSSEKIIEMGKDRNVVLTGFVRNLIDIYEQCSVFVVPLRAGSGIRGKILESMALGRPVVSTSVGCEGLGATHKKNIMIADNPKEFAECTIELLKHPEERKLISKNARQFVEKNYSWDAISERLLDVYAKLLFERD